MVKRLREQQKMSRAQLSSASRLTLPVILNVERGKADDATVTDIVRLSFRLNQPAEDFVTQVVEVLEKLGQS